MASNLAQFDRQDNADGEPGKQAEREVMPKARPNFGLPDMSMPAFLVKPKPEQNKKYMRYLLGGGVVLALVTTIMLAIVSGNLNTANAYPYLCLTSDCLRAAANVEDFMNASAEPCTDFYQYSCGNFKNLYPCPTRSCYEVTRIGQLRRAARDVLKDSIDTMKPQGMAEAKLQTFYKSCVQDYWNTHYGAKPLINEINNVLGGWYSFYNYHAWHVQTFNSVFQKLHSIYGVGPFFRIAVYADSEINAHTRNKRNIINFYPEPLGMGSYYYYLINSSSTMRVREGYKTMIASFITALWQDGHISPPQPANLSQQLVDDVLKIETKLAMLTRESQTSGSRPVHKPIQYLDTTIGHRIHFYDLLNAYFNGAGLTPSTPVKLRSLEYMNQTTKFLNSLTWREVNNYVIFKLAFQYIETLGWKYSQIYNTFIAARSRRMSYSDMNEQSMCLSISTRYMSDAVSAVFVRKHYAYGNSKPQEIFNNMKSALYQRTYGYSWMDSQSQSAARTKIDLLADKIGFPKWILDTTKLDAYYGNLHVDNNQFFSNYKAVQSFQRQVTALKLKLNHSSSSEWIHSLYYPYSTYRASTNLLMLTVGLLQPPIFDPRVPSFINYAALGSIIGDKLTRTIDSDGGHYDGYGVQKEWWTAKAKTNYANVLKCNTGIYNGSTYLVHGEQKPLRNSHYYGDPNERVVAALKMAYSAYKRFVAAQGPEQALPGFQSASIDRAFFLSFGQGFCFNRDPERTFRRRTPPEDLLLNTVVRQMPQFSNIFNCKATAPLAKQISCPGF